MAKDLCLKYQETSDGRSDSYVALGISTSGFSSSNELCCNAAVDLVTRGSGGVRRRRLVLQDLCVRNFGALLKEIHRDIREDCEFCIKSALLWFGSLPRSLKLRIFKSSNNSKGNLLS